MLSKFRDGIDLGSGSNKKIQGKLTIADLENLKGKLSIEDFEVLKKKLVVSEEI